MPRSDAIQNFNDGISAYQNVLHSAGVHLNPLTNPTREAIDERMNQIERAKENTTHPERMQKLNRLRNYLLEINYETQ
ncbi:hypothetical protein Har1130_03765 [Haloarcula sp. CBA1130]|uniref:hypothetical protein n=1 Tax=unclassified Haloarcula TaxID=2624677 RepID=UPI0012462EDB|nr:MULTISPECIES: hypothetical protein [unclassified Haloarcula]KAA9401904.1 hypothetical protein Har1130_03765 [Haloarcula sp. CBA1130]